MNPHVWLQRALLLSRTHMEVNDRSLDSLPSSCFLSRMGFHITDATCYLTADLFYLEVVLVASGGVEEVKVAPQGAPPAVSAVSNKQLTSLPLLLCGLIKGNCFTVQWLSPAAAEVRGRAAVHFSLVSKLQRLIWHKLFKWTVWISTQVKELCWVLREVIQPLHPVQHPRRQVRTRKTFLSCIICEPLATKSIAVFIFSSSETKLKLFASLQHLGKDLQQLSHLPRWATGNTTALKNLFFVINKV